jgi:hypothetical protein
MESARLSEYWLDAGKLLGFAVEAPYQLKLSDGRSFVFSARLPQFGAARGMLLAEHYESFTSAVEALVQAGYGYSVLDAPNHPPSREDVLDVLQDWGWSASSPPPAWLGEA